MSIRGSIRLAHNILKDRKQIRVIPKLLRDKIDLKIIPKILNVRDEEWIRLNSWRFGDISRVLFTDIFPGIEDIDIVVLNCFKRVIGLSIDPLEVFYLNSIAKFIEVNKVCEIGTYDGNTILNLAANAPEEAALTTIDLPPDFDGRFEVEIPEYRRVITEGDVIGSQYKNTIYEKKIKQIYCDSATLEWDTLDGPFDLVFIDGCHDHKYVMVDTENAYRHLSLEGVIVWHDYGMVKDISDVVDNYRDKMDIKVIAGTRLAVGRKI